MIVALWLGRWLLLIGAAALAGGHVLATIHATVVVPVGTAAALHVMALVLVALTASGLSTLAMLHLAVLHLAMLGVILPLLLVALVCRSRRSLRGGG
jgi:hypothetical protein